MNAKIVPTPPTGPLCDGCDAGCEDFETAAIQGIDIEVGYQDKIIIQPMDVAIPEGKITTIIGPNGCGKSTLLKALSRTMPLKSGKVYLQGRDLSTLRHDQAAQIMAFRPQSPQAPGVLTVRELVSYGRYPHQHGLGRLNAKDKEIIDWALTMTHLTDYASRAIDALSGGQRQRAWIAMALAQDTDLILLDEPTTYLDMAHQLEVLELLQSLNHDQGKTIALVIHELNLAARFADWMIAMKNGRILAAGTAESVMTPSMMDNVFGLEARIEHDPWTDKPCLASYRLATESSSPNTPRISSET